MTCFLKNLHKTTGIDNTVVVGTALKREDQSGHNPPLTVLNKPAGTEGIQCRQLLSE
jgi:hypothetical protein